MRQLQRIAIFLLPLWLGMNPSAMAGKLQEELITRSFTGDLPEMKKRRLIRALVVYGPTDFFFREGKPRGIQVDLLKEYEKFLNKGKRKETDRVVIAFVPVAQASLRSRERFWDIRVPKIDSIFDNSLVPRPSWSPGVPPQHRKLVAATHRSPI